MISKKSGLTHFFTVLFLSCLYFPAVALNSEIVFENPDINSDNKILYTVNHTIKGCDSYRSAFMADASKSSGAKLLTCYPEKLELLSKGSVLQLRNRYGTARYSITDNTLTWTERTDTIPSDYVRLGPQSVSPDGKWVCYVRRKDIATGDLILKNISTTEETVLNDQGDFSYNSVNVLWSPDSSTLIYEKKGFLYFCDPKALFQKVQMPEEHRRIGDGYINCVRWANAKTLIYINHEMVYRINANELYTRALYAQMVGTGAVVGRLTVKFDSRHDRFWVNANSDTLVLVQANNIISSFKIDTFNFSYLKAEISKPLTSIYGFITDCELYWGRGNECYLWVSTTGASDGHDKTCVYKIEEELSLITVLEDTIKPAVSDDGLYIAFASGSILYVYDLSSWTLISSLKGEKIVSYVWAVGHELIAGGVSTVRSWKPLLSRSNIDTERVLFLSSVHDVFWNSNNAVFASDSTNPSKVYNYDTGRGVWYTVQLDKPFKVSSIKHSIQNGKYRVFTGSAANMFYKNSIYVRTLTGKSVTRALYPDTVKETSPRKRVAIAVEALDNCEGLTYILSALKEYDIDATFFLNGEFIRRYPSETKQIASSGAECASMFFTSADLTDKGFVVDGDFIRRGLARNEDEFFTLTGRELSLLWHAPYYRSTSVMKKSGADAGYKYVEAGRFALDTMTLEDAAQGSGWYLSASQIIAFYAENARDLSVIPVSTGVSKGSRTDYLYEKLDLLIGALIDSGCEIVPLRTIM